MSTVSVRYIVDDVDEALDFYTNRLGFSVDMHPAPTFAAVSRGDLRLLLSAPTGPGGGAQPMPDGRVPEPGGWTASRSRWTTWKRLCVNSKPLTYRSATTSWSGSAVSRSCSTTPRETRSSCSRTLDR